MVDKFNQAPLDLNKEIVQTRKMMRERPQDKKNRALKLFKFIENVSPIVLEVLEENT